MIQRVAPMSFSELPTAETLIEQLRPQHPRWTANPGEWIFRGQWDATWPLLPTAHRAEGWRAFAIPGHPAFEPAAHPLEEYLVQREIEMLEAFLSEADRVATDIPNDVLVRHMFKTGNRHRVEEFLADPAVQVFAALAQHHGIPTRLLDWTRVGLNAAYFASAGLLGHRAKADAQDKPIDLASGALVVWALSTTFVQWATEREVYAGLSGKPRLRSVTAPRASNPNLHAQAGLFTMWWNAPGIQPLDKVVASVLDALHQGPDTAWQGESPLVRFELPRTEAPKLLRLLAYEQIDAARMFPGRDGVVQALKERGLWDREK